MISRDEIAQVAKMMRIEISDYDAHVPKIQKMLDYFDHLDAADSGDAFAKDVSVTLEELREDRAEESAELDRYINKDGEFVRSPKLR